MARQLRLSLRKALPLTREAFVEGPSNAVARTALDAWPRWPGGTLALVGPEGVGKSHLARAWAVAAKAVLLDRAAPMSRPPPAVRPCWRISTRAATTRPCST